LAKFEPRGRKVKILATLGPASRSPEMIEKLLRAGADAFRVNMSHGDHETHAQTIAAIREVEKSLGRPVAVLCDLQGPKLRVGVFKDGKAVIRHSSHFTFDRDPAPGDGNRVCLPHPELFGILRKGQRLLIDDGKLRLIVIEASDDNPLLGRGRRGDHGPQGRQCARCGGPGPGADRQGPPRPRLRA
jgi:pyruvate kinase